MKIVRVEKNKFYTTISNYHLEDRNLSLKAMGLMTFILHLPEDWDMSISGLDSVLKDGETSIASALKELIEHGYLVRYRERDEQGKLSKNEYVVFETPQLALPNLENPRQDNQGQINTNINKILNKKKTKENKKIIIKENFEKFWNTYPKKKDKSKAEKWFEKNKPSDELMKTILESLEKFKKTEDWKKDNGKYIPYPTTWLNGHRWEDEISVDEIEMTDEEMNEEIERQLREEGFYDNR